MHCLLAAFIMFLAVSCGKSGGESPVGEEVNVESVTLSELSLELVVVEKQILTGQVLPENASNEKLIWSIDDNSIASVNNYGHVVGKSPGKAILHVITDDGGMNASCEVTVYSSRDVCISGYSYVGANVGNYEPLLWKNGKVEKLPSDSYSSTTSDVFATDADVCVVGNLYKGDVAYEGSSPAVWKNGTMILLAEQGSARSVFVFGGDVYVAGSNDDHACIWKNGEINILAEYGMVNSVFIVGGDVYAGGYEDLYNS